MQEQITTGQQKVQNCCAFSLPGWESMDAHFHM